MPDVTSPRVEAWVDNDAVHVVAYWDHAPASELPQYLVAVRPEAVTSVIAHQQQEIERQWREATGTPAPGTLTGLGPDAAMHAAEDAARRAFDEAISNGRSAQDAADAAAAEARSAAGTVNRSAMEAAWEKAMRAALREHSPHYRRNEGIGIGFGLALSLVPGLGALTAVGTALRGAGTRDERQRTDGLGRGLTFGGAGWIIAGGLLLQLSIPVAVAGVVAGFIHVIAGQWTSHHALTPPRVPPPPSPAPTPAPVPAVPSPAPAPNPALSALLATGAQTDTELATWAQQAAIAGLITMRETPASQLTKAASGQRIFDVTPTTDPDNRHVKALDTVRALSTARAEALQGGRPFPQLTCSSIIRDTKDSHGAGRSSDFLMSFDNPKDVVAVLGALPGNRRYGVGLPWESAAGFNPKDDLKEKIRAATAAWQSTGQSPPPSLKGIVDTHSSVYEATWQGTTYAKPRPLDETARLQLPVELRAALSALESRGCNILVYPDRGSGSHMHIEIDRP